MSPHSSKLMWYIFSWDLMPAYWSIIDSHVTSSRHTNVLLIFMISHSSILMCYWFTYMEPYSSILKCSWLSCELIPAYWCAIDYHMTSFQHTEILSILMWPYSSILMCYCFACDLIPAYRSIIDSQVSLFLHINVLLFLMWPHPSILRYYSFSGHLIPAH